jgi:AcrR family transcriptional regulator
MAERRAQLLQTALDVATKDGIAAVTVRRVAEDAGVALGVVHYCFADKDELLAAMAQRIVDDLVEAGAAGLTEPATAPDLLTALEWALRGLWSSIESTRDAQLLTYEITTFALRQPSLREVADRQYAVSQAAAEGLIGLASDLAGAVWTRPLAEIAAQALAFVDGVTLRWLVDGDGVSARNRLQDFAVYLAGQVSGPQE